MPRPLCNCRTPKPMPHSRFINACFVWRGHYCATCHTAVFTARTQALGYWFTHRFASTEILAGGALEDAA